MTQCVHDHSRCCQFPLSCVHRQPKSGQCDAGKKRGYTSENPTYDTDTCDLFVFHNVLNITHRN